MSINGSLSEVSEVTEGFTNVILPKCWNATIEDSAVFDMSPECKAFDFYVYTVFVGSLCCLGIVGNCVSFAVLSHDDGKTATAFLLRSLAVRNVQMMYYPTSL